MVKRKKIGLALSGGGARGLAHIGVIKVLQENNIPIDFIAGTSMGAVVGAFYCAEFNIKKLEKDVLSINWGDMFSYHIPIKSLIKSKRIEDLLREKLGHITFSDLRMPLFISAFDIDSKREVIFSKGDLVKAIRASISIPGLFSPVVNKGRILVDGGVVDPVPTEILKGKADIIIAVNVNQRKKKAPILNEEAMAEKKYNHKSIPGLLECAARSLQIFVSELSEADLMGDETDFIININLEDIGTLDFSKSKQIIKRGENKTRELMDEIKKTSKKPHRFKDFLVEFDKTFSLGILDPQKKKTI